MIIPDSILASTATTEIIATTAETTYTANYAADQSLSASFASNLIVANLDIASLIANNIITSVNALLNIVNIETYADLDFPSVYKRLINADFPETLYINDIELFKFDINKVLNDSILCEDFVRPTLRPLMSMDAFVFDDTVINLINPRKFEQLNLIETISFRFNSDYIEVLNVTEVLRTRLARIVVDIFHFDFEDSIDNIVLGNTQYEFVEFIDDLTFSINKGLFDVLATFDAARAKLSTSVTPDTYIFAPTDYIGNIRLTLFQIDYFQIAESFVYNIRKKHYDSLIIIDPTASKVRTSKLDSYSFVDIVNKFRIKTALSDSVPIGDYQSSTIKTTLYSSFELIDFVPRYVQRFTDEMSIYEQFELKELDAVRLQILDVTEQLYLILKRKVYDTLNTTDLTVLTLRSTRNETVQYEMAISGFVDNYFEPGYCTLGYAGIPI
jgi:hypothetical protein